MDLFLCRGALVRGVDGSEADVLEVDRGVWLRVLNVGGFSRVVGAGPAVAAGHLTGRDCTVITYHRTSVKPVKVSFYRLMVRLCSVLTVNHGLNC